MNHTIPARADVDVRFTWNLADLFPSDDAWRAEFARVHGELDTLRGYQGTLGQSAGNLLSFLQLGDRLSLALDRLGNYARRKADEDTRNAAYQEMSAQFMNLAVETGEASAFETPELLAIDEETLDGFYAAEPALEHYRLALTRVRRRREHALSHEGEALLAAAGQLGQAPDEIFSMLNDADMAFPDAEDSEGKRHPVTHGTFIPLMQSPDRALRRSAFASLYGVYRQFRNTSAAVLSAQMKQLQFFANARKYPSALHASLDDTEVPVEIYHNLIAAVRQGLPAMHRYVRLRKKLLGVEQLHYYDLYTPIVADQDIHVSYEEAKDLALRALLNPGEEVLVPEPSYVSYAPCVIFAGGSPVAVPTSEANNFVLTPEALEKAITPQTKAMIMPYPNNHNGGTDLQRSGTRQHCVPAGHEGADDLPQRLLQGLRHDRLAHGLSLRPRRFHGRDVQNSPVRHHVCAPSGAGGRAGGPAPGPGGRLPGRDRNAPELRPPPPPDGAGLPGYGAELLRAAGRVLRVPRHSEDRLDQRGILHPPSERGKGGLRARHGLWPERRRPHPLLLRHGAFSAQRGAGAHEALP